MKKFYFLMAAVCVYLSSQAQTDSTAKKEEADTIRVGRMIIIRKGRPETQDTIRPKVRQRVKPANVSTNWGIVDIGFNNYSDNTNYSSMEALRFAPGSNKEWFKLKNGKSVNVNVWFFMQKVNMISHVVNLKYGLGLELNNYRYEENIRFREDPTQVYMDVIKYSKNKLAADYITVPMMLNFNFTPKNAGSKSFGFSAGASAGYLYSARQKYISGETGKRKTKDDFDLRPIKLSYIGELHLGPVKFYGSLAHQSMFKNVLDQTPYNVGIRLSSW